MITAAKPSRSSAKAMSSPTFTPHLISTPGFDPAPFLTAAVWVTRDPETGAYNLGIYRGMIKAPDRIGCATDVSTQHLAIQWEKARRMGKPLEVALFLGGPPSLLLAAATPPAPIGAVVSVGTWGTGVSVPLGIPPSTTTRPDFAICNLSARSGLNRAVILR